VKHRFAGNVVDDFFVDGADSGVSVQPVVEGVGFDFAAVDDDVFNGCAL